MASSRLVLLIVHCSPLDPFKRPLNIFHRIPQHHRPSVRARHWVVGFGQFGEQPFHLVLLERHVDFDGRMARDRGGDASAYLFQVQRLLFARELVEEFVQHAFDGGRLDSCRRDFHRHAACAEGLGLESVMLQFVGNFGEYRLLCRRQLQHNRHQQALAFHSLRRTLLQHALEQDAFVRYVLVHDP